MDKMASQDPRKKRTRQQNVITNYTVRLSPSKIFSSQRKSASSSKKMNKAIMIKDESEDSYDESDDSVAHSQPVARNLRSRNPASTSSKLNQRPKQDQDAVYIVISSDSADSDTSRDEPPAPMRLRSKGSTQRPKHPQKSTPKKAEMSEIVTSRASSTKSLAASQLRKLHPRSKANILHQGSKPIFIDLTKEPSPQLIFPVATVVLEPLPQSGVLTPQKKVTSGKNSSLPSSVHAKVASKYSCESAKPPSTQKKLEVGGESSFLPSNDRSTAENAPKKIRTKQTNSLYVGDDKAESSSTNAQNKVRRSATLSSGISASNSRGNFKSAVVCTIQSQDFTPLSDDAFKSAGPSPADTSSKSESVALSTTRKHPATPSSGNDSRIVHSSLSGISDEAGVSLGVTSSGSTATSPILSSTTRRRVHRPMVPTSAAPNGNACPQGLLLQTKESPLAIKKSSKEVLIVKASPLGGHVSVSSLFGKNTSQKINPRSPEPQKIHNDYKKMIESQRNLMPERYAPKGQGSANSQGSFTTPLVSEAAVTPARQNKLEAKMARASRTGIEGHFDFEGDGKTPADKLSDRETLSESRLAIPSSGKQLMKSGTITEDHTKTDLAVIGQLRPPSEQVSKRSQGGGGPNRIQSPTRPASTSKLSPILYSKSFMTLGGDRLLEKAHPKYANSMKSRPVGLVTTPGKCMNDRSSGPTKSDKNMSHKKLFPGTIPKFSPKKLPIGFEIRRVPPTDINAKKEKPSDRRATCSENTRRKETPSDKNERSRKREFVRTILASLDEGVSPSKRSFVGGSSGTSSSKKLEHSISRNTHHPRRPLNSTSQVHLRSENWGIASHKEKGGSTKQLSIASRKENEAVTISSSIASGKKSKAQLLEAIFGNSTKISKTCQRATTASSDHTESPDSPKLSMISQLSHLTRKKSVSGSLTRKAVLKSQSEQRMMILEKLRKSSSHEVTKTPQRNTKIVVISEKAHSNTSKPSSSQAVTMTTAHKTKDYFIHIENVFNDTVRKKFGLKNPSVTLQSQSESQGPSPKFIQNSPTNVQTASRNLLNSSEAERHPQSPKSIQSSPTGDSGRSLPKSVVVEDPLPVKNEAGNEEVQGNANQLSITSKNSLNATNVSSESAKTSITPKSNSAQAVATATRKKDDLVDVEKFLLEAMKKKLGPKNPPVTSQRKTGPEHYLLNNSSSESVQPQEEQQKSTSNASSDYLSHFLLNSGTDAPCHESRDVRQPAPKNVHNQHGSEGKSGKTQHDNIQPSKFGQNSSSSKTQTSPPTHDQKQSSGKGVKGSTIQSTGHQLASSRKNESSNISKKINVSSDSAVNSTSQSSPNSSVTDKTPSTPKINTDPDCVTISVSPSLQIKSLKNFKVLGRATVSTKTLMKRAVKNADCDVKITADKSKDESQTRTNINQAKPSLINRDTFAQSPDPMKNRLHSSNISHSNVQLDSSANNIVPPSDSPLAPAKITDATPTQKEKSVTSSSTSDKILNTPSILSQSKPLFTVKLSNTIVASSIASRTSSNRTPNLLKNANQFVTNSTMSSPRTPGSRETDCDVIISDCDTINLSIADIRPCGDEAQSMRNPETPNMEKISITCEDTVVPMISDGDESLLQPSSEKTIGMAPSGGCVKEPSSDLGESPLVSSGKSSENCTLASCNDARVLSSVLPVQAEKDDVSGLKKIGCDVTIVEFGAKEGDQPTSSKVRLPSLSDEYESAQENILCSADDSVYLTVDESAHLSADEDQKADGAHEMLGGLFDKQTFVDDILLPEIDSEVIITESGPRLVDRSVHKTTRSVPIVTSQQNPIAVVTSQSIQSDNDRSESDSVESSESDDDEVLPPSVMIQKRLKKAEKAAQRTKVLFSSLSPFPELFESKTPTKRLSAASDKITPGPNARSLEKASPVERRQESLGDGVVTSLDVTRKKMNEKRQLDAPVHDPKKTADIVVTSQPEPISSSDSLQNSVALHVLSPGNKTTMTMTSQANGVNDRTPILWKMLKESDRLGQDSDKSTPVDKVQSPPHEGAHLFKSLPLEGDLSGKSNPSIVTNQKDLNVQAAPPEDSITIISNSSDDDWNPTPVTDSVIPKVDRARKPPNRDNVDKLLMENYMALYTGIQNNVVYTEDGDDDDVIIGQRQRNVSESSSDIIIVGDNGTFNEQNIAILDNTVYIEDGDDDVVLPRQQDSIDESCCDVTMVPDDVVISDNGAYIEQNVIIQDNAVYTEDGGNEVVTSPQQNSIDERCCDVIMVPDVIVDEGNAVSPPEVPRPKSPAPPSRPNLFDLNEFFDDDDDLDESEEDDDLPEMFLQEDLIEFRRKRPVSEDGDADELPDLLETPSSKRRRLQLSQESQDSTSKVHQSTIEMLNDSIESIHNNSLDNDGWLEGTSADPNDDMRSRLRSLEPRSLELPKHVTAVLEDNTFSEAYKKHGASLRKLVKDKLRENKIAKMEESLKADMKRGFHHILDDSDEMEEGIEEHDEATKKAMSLMKKDWGMLPRVAVDSDMIRKGGIGFCQHTMSLDKYFTEDELKAFQPFIKARILSCKLSDSVSLRKYTVEDLLDQPATRVQTVNWVIDGIVCRRESQGFFNLIHSKMKNSKDPLIHFQQFKTLLCRAGVKQEILDVEDTKDGSRPFDKVCPKCESRRRCPGPIWSILKIVSHTTIIRQSISVYAEYVTLLLLALHEVRLRRSRLDISALIMKTIQEADDWDDMKFLIAQQLLDAPIDLEVLKEVVINLDAMKDRAAELSRIVAFSTLTFHIHGTDISRDEDLDNLETYIGLVVDFTPTNIEANLDVGEEELNTEKQSFHHMSLLLPMLGICFGRKCKDSRSSAILDRILGFLRAMMKRIRDNGLIYRSQVKYELTAFTKALRSVVQKAPKSNKSSIFKYLRAPPVEEEVVNASFEETAEVDQETEIHP